MEQDKKIMQYGLWESPISPLNMARGIGFSDVAMDDDGSLVWLENRADRGVLVVQPSDGQARRDLNAEFSIRAKVGYGGGDFSVRGGNVYFVESKSGRIYLQPTQGGLAKALTPGFGSAASPSLSPNGEWLLHATCLAPR
jgi:hypothetical protein